MNDLIEVPECPNCKTRDSAIETPLMNRYDEYQYDNNGGNIQIPHTVLLYTVKCNTCNAILLQFIK